MCSERRRNSERNKRHLERIATSNDVARKYNILSQKEDGGDLFPSFLAPPVVRVSLLVSSLRRAPLRATYLSRTLDRKKPLPSLSVRQRARVLREDALARAHTVTGKEKTARRLTAIR